MSIKNSINIGLSKIAKTVGDGANTVAQKSSEFVEISKLNLNISSEKNNIEELYREIGRVVYSKYENGEIIDKDLEDSCQQLGESYNKIMELEDKIDNIKKSTKANKKEEVKCDTEGTCTEYKSTEGHKIEDAKVEELHDSILKPEDDELVENCEGGPCNFTMTSGKDDDLIK
ncbi:hypothetical protein [Clostridium tetani]|uniref:Uncharacterized protein n=1 Tax=Clostridium tetani TaxID=1513 RepID=A0ABY0EXC0_CLOTA|nr:hypothetical protein [Clostridium tetani]RXI37322.1 hypothetical protein DP129_14130 [Clostridium tetani]RXI59333.1 hypothetical protein DP131_00060 [Clostridium tetani]RXI74154.1 hypothetical protein DQN76_00620 [Clostridium tetani]CDI48088.1 hypothetical protein BN906_00004 [Clostridium tetani 12124569]